MADRAWKAFERRLCRDVGTERIPVTGERHGSDGETERFCFQFKLRSSLPRWLFAWLDGICGSATRQGKTGVLVLKVPRMRDDQALVVMRWRDCIGITSNRCDNKAVPLVRLRPGWNALIERFTQDAESSTATSTSVAIRRLPRLLTRGASSLEIARETGAPVIAVGEILRDLSAHGLVESQSTSASIPNTRVYHLTSDGIVFFHNLDEELERRDR